LGADTTCRGAVNVAAGIAADIDTVGLLLRILSRFIKDVG